MIDKIYWFVFSLSLYRSSDYYDADYFKNWKQGSDKTEVVLVHRKSIEKALKTIKYKELTDCVKWYKAVILESKV